MSARTVAMDAAPLVIDPQIDDRGRAWVGYQIAPEHAAVLAEQIIARLRTNHRALCRIHAAATATALPISDASIAVLAALLGKCQMETDAETARDLGDQLLDDYDRVTSRDAIEAVMGGVSA